MVNELGIPTAVESERAVLAAILNHGPVLDRVRLSLAPGAFYQPKHAELFSLMLDTADAGLSVEPMIVVAELSKRGQLGQWRNGAEVFELIQNGHAAAGNLAWHVAEIRQAQQLRLAQQIQMRLGQQLAESTTEDALQYIAQASVELELVADEPDDDHVEGLTTWDDFHDRYAENDTANWVVPGLLRRQDIMFVLAAPGVGKSFLSRQVVQCLAAGVHPFHPEQRITPVRTLLIDLENAPSQVAEENAPSFQRIKRMGDWAADRGWIWMHQEGLNIRQAADARLLERVIARTRPDVVAFGSLYNAYKRGNDGWDTAAEDVQDVIKKLRKRYDLTFWIEHHMVRATGGGHTGSPFGGTSWEKWPTHGRILERARDEHGQPSRASIYSFAASPNFRGDRGQRELPVGFTRGGRLPWSPVWEPEELELLMAAAR